MYTVKIKVYLIIHLFLYTFLYYVLWTHCIASDIVVFFTKVRSECVQSDFNTFTLVENSTAHQPMLQLEPQEGAISLTIAKLLALGLVVFSARIY